MDHPYSLTGVKDGPSTIMVGRFISHNLYKVDLSEDLDMESNNPANVKIQTCVMTASTSKSATNLFTWHRRFAHLNEASVKRLPDLVMGMDILASNYEKLPFCEVCVKSKITRQPHREPRNHPTQPGFRSHADVGGGVRHTPLFEAFGILFFLIVIQPVMSG